MTRFHSRGRNSWWSDGRPPGFAMPLDRRRRRPRLGRTFLMAVLLGATMALLAWLDMRALFPW